MFFSEHNKLIKVLKETIGHKDEHIAALESIINSHERNIAAKAEHISLLQGHIKELERLIYSTGIGHTEKNNEKLSTDGPVQRESSDKKTSPLSV